MLERIFVRENSDYSYSTKSAKQKIGVLGISKGSGSSFVALSLAKELSKNTAKRVAYVEMPAGEHRGEGCIYDSLGMDKRFAAREFNDFYLLVSAGIPISQKLNLDENINWALEIPKIYRDEKDEKDGKDGLRNRRAEFCTILNNIAGDVIIADLGGNRDIKLMSEFDAALCVIDPLPSRLLAGYEMLCQMKKWQKAGGRVLFVLNKFNGGINRKDLRGCLNFSPDVVLGNVDTEEIYLSEYNCQIPYSRKRIAEQIGTEIKEISEFVTLL